jgi:hypothetical protein
MHSPKEKVTEHLHLKEMVVGHLCFFDKLWRGLLFIFGLRSTLFAFVVLYLRVEGHSLGFACCIILRVEPTYIVIMRHVGSGNWA